MNISNYRTFKVFSEYELSHYIREQRNEIQSEINRKSENDILNEDQTDYINYLVEKSTIDPICLYFKEKNTQ
ncbi:MAG: hypothetical protein OXU36_18710 [Candidatus Poribacteria bacterium]|nr:hypothetical protein [Candidatus Poribacteria bacterium]